MTAYSVIRRRDQVVVEKQRKGCFSEPYTFTPDQAKGLAVQIITNAKRQGMTVYPLAEDYNFIFDGNLKQADLLAKDLFAAASQEGV